jgi:GDP-L-fucose synthase
MTLPPNSVVLVTGGTGLVGSALKYVIENEPVGSKFGKSSENEQWIFLTSKDGDLR